MLTGIDGGGSKNDLVLLHNDGTLLRRIVFKGGSVSELGAHVAAARLRSQLEVLLDGFGGLNAPIDALFAGLSGGGNASSARIITSALKEALPHARSVRTAGDTLTALYAGVGSGDGMAVIAGTGSSAYVRHDGAYTLVGGWGHLIDDAGSGFWIGREVLNAALRNLDGRSDKTLLTALVNHKLGKDVRLCIAELYEGGKRTIASFAPLLFDAAAGSDPAALAILSRAADELALLIRAGGAFISKKPCRAALIGSLWRADMLREAVEKRLNEDYILLPLCVPPVLGSACAAAEDAGLHADDAFRSHLLSGLKAVGEAAL